MFNTITGAGVRKYHLYQEAEGILSFPVFLIEAALKFS